MLFISLLKVLITDNAFLYMKTNYADEACDLTQQSSVLCSFVLILGHEIRTGFSKAEAFVHMKNRILGTR